MLAVVGWLTVSRSGVMDATDMTYGTMLINENCQKSRDLRIRSLRSATGTSGWRTVCWINLVHFVPRYKTGNSVKLVPAREKLPVPVSSIQAASRADEWFVLYLARVLAV